MRTLFANKIYKFDGNAFQQFFESIMQKRHASEFRTIKPHGNKGDGGNDGFIPAKGEYFQVYSPESPSDSVANACKKSKSDFENLLENWNETEQIKIYRFAFNDKFKGAYPDVETTLSEIKSHNSLDDASPFYAQHLEATFLELGEDDQREVLGTIFPSATDLGNIEFAEITEVLEYLMENSTPVSMLGVLSVPDFSEKIQFNDLSNSVGALLTVASFQIGVMEEYFTSVPGFSRNDIRNRMLSIYEEAEEFHNQESNPEGISDGDLIFFSMLENIIPTDSKASQDVGITLIAYFFEKCDVFKEPLE